MKISVFGLGYVGCISVGCFADKGYSVTGVDIDQRKIDLINSGKPTIVEDGLDILLESGVKNRLIKATDSVKVAVENSDIAFICIGTPNSDQGHLDMLGINKVIKEISKQLVNKKSFFIIVIRSTVMPGTNLSIIKRIEKESGKINGSDFGVVSNPEFLREGSAIKDFYYPPFTIVASSSEKAIKKMENLFSFISSPFIRVDVEIAELIKFLNNSYHALKVSFANEIGRICKKIGVNSIELMNIFVKDDILNISPKYFRPGFSYGGSCLPKDLKALSTIAHDNYVNTPILDSISKSNREHNDFVYNLIKSYNKKKIGIYGLSFKPGTDDLRFSPSLNLSERLIGKGYQLTIFDENVRLSQLYGANKDYLVKRLPHISELLCPNIEEFIQDVEIIVFVHNDKKIIQWKNNIIKNVIIIDLANIEVLKEHKRYIGVSW